MRTYIHLARRLQRRRLHGASTATSGLHVLTAHLKAPVMTETAMAAHLLEALKILAPLGLEGVGKHLQVLAGLDILLPVKQPDGDLELKRVLDDGHQTLDLVRLQLTSAVGEGA
jgi:hypothetical protein